jgi:hypothetical protein
MSHQSFIYQNSAGNISVGTPTDQALQTQTIEQIASKDTPAGVQWYVVDSSALPVDTAFFNSWVFTVAPEVAVDLDKAKVQFKSAEDASAASLSTPLTQEYMRLMAIGADTTAVQAQLRAINAAAEETAYLDATTVPQLVACWPAELGPNPVLPAVAE